MANYRAIGRALAAAATRSREERLFDALCDVTACLVRHLQDAAKAAGVTVEEVCPCYTETVLPAQALIEEIDKEASK